MQSLLRADGTHSKTDRNERKTVAGSTRASGYGNMAAMINGSASMASPTDSFFRSGTPWCAESRQLRTILLTCGLSEELKWGKPCYTCDGHNVVILQKMKHFLALLFFKGSLLKDPRGVLEKPGPNARVGRRLRFVSPQEVEALGHVVEEYIHEAIELNKAGLRVEKPIETEWVAELQEKLSQDAQFGAAFVALTPGRQRAYNFHFSAAKQSATRIRRIEKYVPKILAGQGLQD